MSALQIIWFALIAVLLIGYAILDGFDLGVGVWHLFVKGEDDRRSMLNAIGPVWDGNEVWLLTGGGALFAAFPPVYATVFSAFYLALVLVLMGLIFRAVSMEFRSKVDSPTWKTAWDVAFSIGSLLPALLFGVALGNVMRGLPIDADGNYTGTFIGLLNPWSLAVGVTGLAMIAMHGALYMSLKAEGDLEVRARKWALGAWGGYALLFVALTVWTWAAHPLLTENYLAMPAFFLAPAIALAGIASVPVLLRKRAIFPAFLASSVSIAGIMLTAGLALFPNLVPALGDPELSLTIWDSSSTQRTLTVMLVLAVIGVPAVLAYTVYVYRTFRGKVRREDHVY